MGDEYGYPEKRKSDKKRKRQMYRRGGKYRSTMVDETTSKGKEHKKKK